MALIPRKVRRNRKMELRNAAVKERMEAQAQRRARAAARKPAAPGDALSAGRRFAPYWLRKIVLERDGFRCRYCHRPVTNDNANIDHIIPWPFGLTVLDNLAACCRPCNQAKGSRMPR